MLPNAAWSGVQYVMVLVATSAAGLIFRHWVAAHWIEVAVNALLLVLITLLVAKWATNAANRIFARELESLRAEHARELESLRAEHARELQSARAEAADAYADVVLYWLHQNIKGGPQIVPAERIAQALKPMTVEQITRGLECLRDRWHFVEGGDGGWTLNEESRACVPFFVRNPNRQFV
jgi:hypothetical protein